MTEEEEVATRVVHEASRWSSSGAPAEIDQLQIYARIWKLRPFTDVREVAAARRELHALGRRLPPTSTWPVGGREGRRRGTDDHDDDDDNEEDSSMSVLADKISDMGLSGDGEAEAEAEARSRDDGWDAEGKGLGSVPRFRNEARGLRVVESLDHEEEEGGQSAAEGGEGRRGREERGRRRSRGRDEKRRDRGDAEGKGKGKGEGEGEGGRGTEREEVDRRGRSRTRTRTRTRTSARPHDGQG